MQREEEKAKQRRKKDLYVQSRLVRRVADSAKELLGTAHNTWIQNLRQTKSAKQNGLSAAVAVSGWVIREMDRLYASQMG